MIRRMTFTTDPKVTDYNNGIYNILMPVAFNTYLVVGEEKSLLIDTGMGIGSLKTIVRRLTSLPVQVLNTHGHPDHAGGNAEFGPAFIHPDDRTIADSMANLAFRKQDISHILQGEHPEMLSMLQPDSDQDFIYLSDRQTIDLGNRVLSVYHTPGHTPGSVCVYDARTGTLFGGDTVQPYIGMSSDPRCSFKNLLAGLIKMESLKISRIMYGHNMPTAVREGRDLLDTIILLLRGIEEGTASFTQTISEDETIRRYSLGEVHLSVRV